MFDLRFAIELFGRKTQGLGVVFINFIGQRTSCIKFVQGGPPTSYKWTYNGLKIAIFLSPFGIMCFGTFFPSIEQANPRVISGIMTPFTCYYIYKAITTRWAPTSYKRSHNPIEVGFFHPQLSIYVRPFILHKVFFTQF